MPSRKCATKAKFTGECASCDDTCELASIIARIRRMRSSNTQKVKACRLRLKDCATPYGADLNARHGD